MARKKGKSTITQATENYEAQIPHMRTNFSAGMQRFFEGADVSGSTPVKKYLQKIQPGKSADYNKGLKRRFGLAV
jgi:hypothetical protein